MNTSGVEMCMIFSKVTNADVDRNIDEVAYILTHSDIDLPNFIYRFTEKEKDLFYSKSIAKSHFYYNSFVPDTMIKLKANGKYTELQFKFTIMKSVRIVFLVMCLLSVIIGCCLAVNESIFCLIPLIFVFAMPILFRTALALNANILKKKIINALMKC